MSLIYVLLVLLTVAVICTIFFYILKIGDPLRMWLIVLIVLLTVLWLFFGSGFVGPIHHIQVTR